jgi:DNA mismatch repair ATPase MutS
VRAGRHAREWLEALGEAEALSALAGLLHANPDWALPAIDPSADRVEAKEIGHPLIPGDKRVTNDVEVGPPSTFLLVTGSNMSGKSTLLRSIGVNVVLANAGGPVCAQALTLPPVALWTSMRIEDSLEMGVSYFMAELQRLKAVVEAAHTVRAGGERRLLYLLDEILQGTNTAERQIAARRIILHLVHEGAIGAVSTHDLNLAENPEVAEAARLVHFTETIHRGPEGLEMTFDYKLRPGIATSTNALKLMEIVGLDLD